jgi:hypothetical protein
VTLIEIAQLVGTLAGTAAATWAARSSKRSGKSAEGSSAALAQLASGIRRLDRRLGRVEDALDIDPDSRDSVSAALDPI